VVPSVLGEVAVGIIVNLVQWMLYQIGNIRQILSQRNYGYFLAAVAILRDVNSSKAYYHYCKMLWPLQNAVTLIAFSRDLFEQVLGLQQITSLLQFARHMH